jgi:predicted adenylyl cyclase CyaB
MRSNVEIKARVQDPLRFARIAAELSSSRQRLRQEDVFFDSPRGRLKLRCSGEGTGELIYYERPDQSGPKQSRYCIYRTCDPEGLRLALSSALGVVGVVRKTRELFLVGQTRIHLDDVEGLGTFAELEVVMEAGQTVESGRALATDLMRKLDVSEADLVDRAYLDLLLERDAGKGTHRKGAAGRGPRA